MLFELQIVTFLPPHSVVLVLSDPHVPEGEVSPVDGVEDEEEEGGEEEEEPVHLSILIIPSGVFLASPLPCPGQTTWQLPLVKQWLIK